MRLLGGVRGSHQPDWGLGGVGGGVVFTTAQVNQPVCVHVGGGRPAGVGRTAVVAVGAIGADKDPRRPPGPPTLLKRMLFSP